jgi:hypothetical protein
MSRAPLRETERAQQHADTDQNTQGDARNAVLLAAQAAAHLLPINAATASTAVGSSMPADKTAPLC